MSEIYLSLGSNIGQRRDFIEDAIKKLSARIDVGEISSFYETKPWGKIDQPNFLNLCLKAETDLSAEDLLAFIKKVEADSGRSESEKWGPREIDIDLLFYGQERIKIPGLVVPHPQLHDRAFVLVPLKEIAGEFIHPALHKTVGELASNIDKSGVTLYGN